MSDLSAVAWPASRLQEGVTCLARIAGFAATPLAAQKNHPCIDLPDEESLLVAVHDMGLEAEGVEIGFDDALGMVQRAAPAIVKIDVRGEQRYVFLARRGRRTVRVITPDGGLASIRTAEMVDTLIAHESATLVADATKLVEETQAKPKRRERLIRAIVRERLRGQRLRRCWIVRIPPGGSFRAQCRSVGLAGAVASLALSHVGEYALWILSWWILAHLVFAGRLDSGWLSAWALTIAVAACVHIKSRVLQGRIAIDLGALLKKRLLQGALCLDADRIRREGVGRLLGRTFEAQAVETLALGGGLSALLAVVQLAFAAAVLVAVSTVLPGLLVLWIGVTVALAMLYRSRRRSWTDARVVMTHELIERMLGYRTQLAQQPDEDWHRGEDESLERYVTLSSAMDRAHVRATALLPRGWLLLALLGMSPALVGVTPPAILAMTAGGVLLAFRGFKRLTISVASLVGAELAWGQVAEVFHAAARAETGAFRRLAAADGAVLQADGIRFSHAGRSDAVLQGCTVAVRARDRIVMRGASGGGKSTFAAICAGLRVPSSGLMLLQGLDRHTVGFEEWRRRIVLVPQFHENHVLLGSFAFNLLLGVSWPPRQGDLARAEQLCRDLGLGDLLDRMPGGLLQMVGETGWQLSHGERSRLFLARALLQQPDLLILDETFAQLDPITVQRTLDTVMQRQQTMLLIAHS